MGADAVADGMDADPPEPGVIVTLFRDGAMIWNRRNVDLSAGLEVVEFAPVPANVDARSATLVSLTAPDSISVLAQEPPTPPPADRPRSLSWTVTTDSTRTHLLEAAYVSPHITWRAHYRLHIAPAPSGGREGSDASESWTGHLSGYLEISNHTSVTIKDAIIRVADTRRVADPGVDGVHDADADADESGDDAGPRFIRLPGRVTLAPRATVQVPLIPAHSEPWPLVHRLLYDPVIPELRGRIRRPDLRRDYGLRDEENPRLGVRTIIEFGDRPDTAPDSAPSPLDLALLPAGRMTVVADTDSGAPRAIGAGLAFERLSDAKSRHVELGTSKAAVEIDRRQTDFFMDEYAERLVEEIRITFHNRDARAHRVFVREHMYRGHNWSVGYNNGVGQPRKLGVQTVRFDVDLAAGASETIMYRVIYSW